MAAPVIEPAATMTATHFGYKSVDEADKARHVRGVFDSVAPRYDVMNDLMSLGLHRAWKAFTLLVADVRDGYVVLDIAGGTGDLALAFSKKVGKTGHVVHTDINEAMLRSGRNRLLDAGVALPTAVCDAEQLPFADNHFHVVSVAFGLRNMTHKDRALAEMHRVLRPGGKCWCLNSPRLWLPCNGPTTGIPSTFCPDWASWWPAMQTVTAIWRSPFACILTNKLLRPCC